MADPPHASRCIYCGDHLPKRRGSGHRSDRNQEHAVARQFFAKPRPKDLDKVVVPSCRACNERDKHDEDYVRSVLLGLSDAGLSETGKKIRDQVGDRVFKKDKGLRARVASHLERVTLRTPSGIVLPEQIAQRADWNAIQRVLVKWTRGLYWKEFGEPLSPEVTFSTAMRPTEILNNGFHFDAFEIGKGSWPGTFEYWHSCSVADPSQTRWSYLVWERVGFVVTTNHTIGIIPGLAILSEEYPGCVIEHAVPMQPQRKSRLLMDRIAAGLRRPI